MRLRPTAPFVPVLLALMLVMLWPTVLEAAQSDTGDVTVEIVPPGTLTGPAATDSSMPAAGTLSASIMWLPDPVEGQTRLHGMFAVQDHRASADGWTVRLYADPPPATHLAKVQVDGTDFGIPDWVYEGIHIWDVAVGAPLTESPQLLTAPEPAGYSLTIHQLWIDVDMDAIDGSGGHVALLLMLPFAP